MMKSHFADDDIDISTLGYEVNPDVFFMWMLRVNEHVCLGKDDYHIPMVLPAADELVVIANDIRIYSNPTSSIVHYSISGNGSIKNVSLFDISG